MKKNHKVLEALGRTFELDELHDGSLSSITGGCGPMGGTNFNCGGASFSQVEGEAFAESICPSKPIFMGGLKQRF